MKIATLVALVMLFAQAFSAGAKAGPYNVELATEPPIVPVGKATLIITVTDATGKAVDGAQVKAIAQMPGMAMGEREQTAVPAGKPGVYTAPASFSMAGGYEAKISVTGPQGSGVAIVPLTTGKSSVASQSSAFPLGLLIGIGAIIALGAFTWYRMRKTGQRVDIRPALSRQVVIALTIFAVVIVAAVYAVNNFRRPGAMTPIEGQVMDMNAPAPEGDTPVTLAVATIKRFDPTVRYSGQVVGYVEQEVYPRTTGTIVWMPYYVGNSVKKGQVLARLDTSQLQPQVTEKAAGLTSARSGVGSAEADYRQSLASVREAEADLSQKQGLIDEAVANLSAAQEAKDAAQAQVRAAESDVGDARARVAAAEADQTYWTEELKRMESLFAAGAVSKDEFQKEKAEAEKSRAGLRQTQQAFLGSEAKLNAARAALRGATASAKAAEKRISQARSELRAQYARIRTAQAAADSARQKISQAKAMVGAAEASLQGATAAAGYAEIRAETDGVITQRLISPGVLVNPGQAILKVAQIQPIRVQANVAEADMNRIRVGSMMAIRHRESAEEPVMAKVSSVSPSLDPSARTGIVEAILANTDKSFLPGQFVSVQISTSIAGSALTIPSSAVQTEVESSLSGVISTQEKHYVWVANPVTGQEERYTIGRASVELGESSGDVVAVTSGLGAGQKVVTSGTQYLRAGQIVTAVPERGSAPMAEATIEITEQGFVPSSVSLSAGRPLKLTFTRKTENTCATEVVFPALKITKPLPLNKPVSVELPAQVEGTLSYACGMDMLKGKVIVR
jgi:RND family efflux transporter MFP subunit